jgi:hypothetical protein
VFQLDLYLRGKELEPDQVTRILGVAPSSTRISGGTQGMWLLRIQGGSPDECVDSLVSRFRGWLRDLSQLPGVDEGQVELVVPSAMGRDPGAQVCLEWDAASIAQLAACRLPLVITFDPVGAEETLLTEPTTDESVLF